MLLGILVLLLETLYCYIIFKEFNIKGKLNRVILFISILITIILSGIILNGSVFRYLFLPTMFFIIIKLLNKKNSIALTCIILIVLFIKYLIEFATVYLFINYLGINIITLIFESIAIIIANILSKYISNINNIIFKKWHGSKKFYIRYTFLICINIFVLFVTYNLIQMKEVF